MEATKILTSAELGIAEGRLGQRYPMILALMNTVQEAKNNPEFSYMEDPEYIARSKKSEKLQSQILNLEYLIFEGKGSDTVKTGVKIEQLTGMKGLLQKLIESVEDRELLSYEYAFIQGFLACSQLRREMAESMSMPLE